MHVIMRDDGRMFCGDNRWREFVSFGTYDSCIKVYKTKSRAEKKAKHMDALAEYAHKTDPKVVTGIQVVSIPEGKYMDACGRILDA